MAMHKGWFRLLMVTYLVGWLPLIGAIHPNEHEAAVIGAIWAILFWIFVRAFLWVKDGFSGPN